MGSTPASIPRAERSDTKTLLRLGTARDSEPRLPPEQRDVLREIAQEGDATGNRVQLWFKGLSAPVRARVRVDGERIRLETLLPFLELDSEVAIARTEDGARLHARIAQVSLAAGAEQSVPRLRVEVALARDDAALPVSAEPAAKIGATETAAATAAAASVVSVQPSSVVTVPAPAPQRSRLLPWFAAFVLGMAGGAAGTGAFLAPWLRAPFAAPVHRSDVPHAEAETARLAPPTETVPAVIPVAVPRVVEAVAPVEIESPVEAALTAEPQAEAQAEGEPEAQAEPALAPTAAPEPAAVAAPGDRGLEIESANGQTGIFVPMQGNADDMERYALTTPGVSFTLPHAHALIATSNYVIEHRPLVRRVWLREHGSGVQVRIILPRASIHDETRFDTDGLHILLHL